MVHLVGKEKLWGGETSLHTGRRVQYVELRQNLDIKYPLNHTNWSSVGHLAYCSERLHYCLLNHFSHQTELDYQNVQFLHLSVTQSPPGLSTLF